MFEWNVLIFSITRGGGVLRANFIRINLSLIFFFLVILLNRFADRRKHSITLWYEIKHPLCGDIYRMLLRKLKSLKTPSTCINKQQPITACGGRSQQLINQSTTISALQLDDWLTANGRARDLSRRLPEPTSDRRWLDLGRVCVYCHYSCPVLLRWRSRTPELGTPVVIR